VAKLVLRVGERAPGSSVYAWGRGGCDDLVIV
jgi:hypothetical protein